MSKTIRWGILGLGGIAEKFAIGLEHVPGAKLHAVGSRSIEKAKLFAERFKAQHYFGTYEELASDPEVDIIYIATPHVLHCENTLMCLDKGKAVLCEKPFAMNEKQVLQMIAKAEEKKLFLMEALWTRFLPTITKTLELINEGAIGEIVHIKSDFGMRAPYHPEKRLFNIELGGGSLLDIGIYPVFIALLLLGKPDEIAAKAAIGKTGVDENLSMIFKYNSGQIATLYSTLLASTPVETEIYGTKGTIKINRMWHIPTSLTLITEGEKKQIEFDYRSNGYDIEAEEATKCLLEGKTEHPYMTHKFSLQLIKLLDNIRETAGIKYKMD
jgi:predicted dehydrogenase